jgi:hypothetical protein
MIPETDLYAEIERRFSFALPEEYRRMRDRGWFGPSESTYLWLHEMEWMSLKDIRDGDPVFFQFTRPGLIPFAFTGGRDHWCWYPEHMADGVAPVVECPRDSVIGRFYAPSFLGAIYRQILDFACWQITPAEESKARRHLKRWLDDLGPLMPDNWRKTIGNLLSAPLRTIERLPGQINGVLLTFDECGMLVQRDLAFPKLDEEFQWMAD